MKGAVLAVLAACGAAATRADEPRCDDMHVTLSRDARTHAAFYEQAMNAMAAHWTPDAARTTSRTPVVLRIGVDRDGVVVAVDVDRSSGVAAVDAEAVAAVQRASPLPAPPDDLIVPATGDATITIRFGVELVAGDPPVWTECAARQRQRDLSEDHMSWGAVPPPAP
jgi:TonB family protein